MSSPGSSDYMRMGRRDSASSSTKRSSRPRLLRASATEPSLSASTATHGAALASPPHSSSRRATDILNRVAYISGTSPPSGQSPLYEGMNERTDTLSSSPTSHSTDEYYTRPHASERYFSFPSFDTWEGQEDNKDNEDKSGD
ncbi:hypothetical protein MCOR25_008072 [Pyricularia grisea]|uniref:Uncharacterized protein n=1 Tax=Pyricularia grisea TaxID=148305 RepID=A0A6P8B7Y9_PYRGI|nr:hypothetical protein PgNI_05999 [Pyricularia grisea]KAI6355866.1 hypothetical protein MCOR25_008072 [Pyricularia grisea]TLD11229.1 hypothetical protein PgNI_05999 [Pyricularia grisea]